MLRPLAKGTGRNSEHRCSIHRGSRIRNSQEPTRVEITTNAISRRPHSIAHFVLQNPVEPRFIDRKICQKLPPKRPERSQQPSPHDHQQEIDVSHVAHIKQNLATGWPIKIAPAGKALVRTGLAPIAPRSQAKDFAQKTPSLKALR